MRAVRPKSIPNAMISIALSVLLVAWFAAPAYAVSAEGQDASAAADVAVEMEPGSDAADSLGDAAVPEGSDDVAATDGVDDPASDVSGDAADGNDATAGADDVELAADGAGEASPDEIADALANAFGETADKAADRPAAVEAPVADGTYLIQPTSSSMYVLASSGSSAVLSLANGSSTQRFVLDAGADGRYTIASEATGRVLDVNGYGDGGAVIALSKASGDDDQAWEIVANGDGTYRIESYGVYGLSLDASSVAAGARIGGSLVESAYSQSFYLVSADGATVPAPDAISAGTYLLATPDGALAAAVADYSMNAGARLSLVSTTGALSQIVVVTVDVRGFAVLRLANSGLAVAAGDGAIVGSPVVQQVANGSAAQAWSAQRNADGTYSLIESSHGLALACASASDGAGLELAPATGADTQRWSLQPVAQLLADGVYSFYSLLDNGYGIDTADDSANAGARAVLNPRDGMPAQKLLVKNASVDTESDGAQAGVTIQSLAGGKYLALDGNGAAVFGNRSGGLEQLWRPVANASGGVTLVNAATGGALAVSGSAAVADVALFGAAFDGTAYQAFRAIQVNAVDNGTYLIQLASTGCVLDVVAGSRNDGANVQVYEPTGAGWQVWDVTAIGDGYYAITSPRTGKALDVADGVAAAGTNVQQCTQWDPPSPSQKWRIEVTSEGAYAFVSACGGYVLEAAGSGASQSNVFIGQPTYSTNQQFRLVPTTYVHEDFLDLLGSFTTYSTNDYNGTYNMMRALNSFNGIVVQPGQTLSFFAVTGPCGAAEGYLPAGVVGGIGYGGGICQASTTLYGATLRAGMTIVDRQNHSVPSTYVPIGLDAMVNWGTSDYQFRNDLDYPIKIVTTTYGNVLTCDIWGTQPDWYDRIEPESWYTSYNSAAAQRVYYKNGQVVYTEALPSSWYW